MRVYTNIGRPRLSTAAHLVIAVTVLASFAEAQANAPAAVGTVIGQVVSQIEGTPIPYAVVSIPGLQRDQFTGADGRFTLPNLPAGSVTIHAKHIGHLPGEVTVTVVAGEQRSAKVVLSRLAIPLPPVFASVPCRRPGMPSADDAPALAALVAQLRENAERYRLLVQQYPFRTLVERRSSRRWASDGKVRELKVDTVLWNPSAYVYAPGTTMQRNQNGELRLLFASLEDFADDAFLENHCFSFAGQTDIDGQKLLEIEFTAWEGITDPDMNGSMFLDPQTYQIKRATYSLSKLPPELQQSGSVTTTTIFDDVLPSIPVIGRVSSETKVKQDVTTTFWEANIEEQVLIEVQFLRGKP